MSRYRTCTGTSGRQLLFKVKEVVKAHQMVMGALVAAERTCSRTRQAVVNDARAEALSRDNARATRPEAGADAAVDIFLLGLDPRVILRLTGMRP
jgi:hypothetical protein